MSLTAVIDTQKNAWVLAEITPGSEKQTITLETKERYVDKHIEVPVGAVTLDIAKSITGTTSRTAGTGYASSTASGITLGTVATSAPSSGAYIAVKGKGDVSTGAGYVTSGTTTSNEKTVYYPVSITAAQAKSLVGTGTAEVNANQTISVSGSSAPTLNSTSGKYEISVSGSKPITGSSTAGYIEADAVTSASVSASGKAEVNAGSIGVAAKDANLTAFGVTNTTAVVPSEGYLTLSAGYYPATKISLATLVPDSVTAANGFAPASYIRTGYGAWDKDGKEITGTMNNASITSGTATVSAGTPTKNTSDPTKYDVPITVSVVAPTVNSAGYISSSEGTKSANNNQSKSIQLAASTLTHSAASGTAGSVKITSAATNVNTATSGNYYITLTGTPSSGTINHNAVTTAGYTSGETKAATITATPSVVYDANNDGTTGDNKLYLSSTNITGSVTAAKGGGNNSNYNAPVTVAASTTVPQVVLTGNGSATSKSVYTGTATAATKYINYFTGTYSIASA